MNRIAELNGMKVNHVAMKAAKFVAFYTDSEGVWMHTEHKSEKAAQKGSWQSADMKRAYAYVGYVPVTEEVVTEKVEEAPEAPAPAAVTYGPASILNFSYMAAEAVSEASRNFWLNRIAAVLAA